jgi:hypothetical protein
MFWRPPPQEIQRYSFHFMSQSLSILPLATTTTVEFDLILVYISVYAALGFSKNWVYRRGAPKGEALANPGDPKPPGAGAPNGEGFAEREPKLDVPPKVPAAEPNVGPPVAEPPSVEGCPKPPEL